ncbi:hypothetical protein O7626_39620 [Micromonospora sp. WMMD1102]|uniref:hypothetical protein n=1 Tax=Micromonospora sp. WMMD1102 TaxID=3016105 RepID=UPI0024151A69|nr:hypothetical protein [Micromonospora sp. WMMD1102]MDG4791924.1 hypothetical protein [Micromonospora sp. WMMD1102]
MTSPTLRLLSLGAGVQSTVLALMTADGTLPRVDGAIFADTGWEPRRVYKHLDRLAVALGAAGIPLYRVSKGNLRNDAIDPDHGFASIPYYTQAPPKPCVDCNATGKIEDPDPLISDERGDALLVNCPRCRGTGRDDGRGMGQRQCTNQYKLALVRRKTRELLGAKAPAYRSVPRGRVAETWVGFSTDEIGRVSDAYPVLYIRKRYPLLDLAMNRKACERWLRARGWGSVEKSACIGCPLHGNRQWRELRDRCDCGHHISGHQSEPLAYPDGCRAIGCDCDRFKNSEWQDAVAFDEAIRHGGANPLPEGVQAFLHSSRVPLSVARIDRVTSKEWADRSPDIFDALAELGDPDGCSPYGCRSGVAA